jgi:hypothetical protein
MKGLDIPGQPFFILHPMSSDLPRGFTESSPTDIVAELRGLNVDLPQRFRHVLPPISDGRLSIPIILDSESNALESTSGKVTPDE